MVVLTPVIESILASLFLVGATLLPMARQPGATHTHARALRTPRFPVLCGCAAHAATLRCSLTWCACVLRRRVAQSCMAFADSLVASARCRPADGALWPQNTTPCWGERDSERHEDAGCGSDTESEVEGAKRDAETRDERQAAAAAAAAAADDASGASGGDRARPEEALRQRAPPGGHAAEADAPAPAA